MVDADTTLVICSIFDGHNFIMFVLAWAGEGESVRNWELRDYFRLFVTILSSSTTS